MSNEFVEAVKAMQAAQSADELTSAFSAARSELSIVPRPSRWSSEPDNRPEDILTAFYEALNSRLTGSKSENRVIGIMSHLLREFGETMLLLN